MVEACPVCDTLWRLYGRASENLHELIGKHTDSRDKGDRNSTDLLAHEIAIAESALGAVRRELRRHEVARHNHRAEEQGSRRRESAGEQSK